MEKMLKKLPESAKTLKVCGQGCNDDCEHMVNAKYHREPIQFVICYREWWTYDYKYYDAHWTSWF